MVVDRATSVWVPGRPVRPAASLRAFRIRLETSRSEALFKEDDELQVRRAFESIAEAMRVPATVGPGVQISPEEIVEAMRGITPLRTIHGRAHAVHAAGDTVTISVG
jgi:Ni,Fe-hydrogenase III small subunit